MEQKIQELTEKLLREGVEQGEARAREIVQQAEKKAADAMAQAQAQAEKIIADARQRCTELKQNAEAEIKLAGQQAISALKQQITEMIMVNIVDRPIAQSLSDPKVVKELLILIVQNWKKEAGQPRLEALLPQSKRQELQAALDHDVQAFLSQNLEIRFSSQVRGGFRIGPVGGSFKISLTDQDFTEFFREYLKSRTRQILFGG